MTRQVFAAYFAKPGSVWNNLVSMNLEDLDFNSDVDVVVAKGGDTIHFPVLRKLRLHCCREASVVLGALTAMRVSIPLLEDLDFRALEYADNSFEDSDAYDMDMITLDSFRDSHKLKCVKFVSILGDIDSDLPRAANIARSYENLTKLFILYGSKDLDSTVYWLESLDPDYLDVICEACPNIQCLAISVSSVDSSFIKVGGTVAFDRNLFSPESCLVITLTPPGGKGELMSI